MAPDMSEVVLAYNAPTAPLTAENIDIIVADVTERVDLLRETGADGSILLALRTAGQAEREGEPGGTTQSTTEPVRSVQQRELVFNDGFLRGVRICDGWGTEPVADIDENGFILLIAGFSKIGFDSVVWGGFFNCKYRVQDVNIELRGATDQEYGLFRAFIGEDIPFNETGNGTTFYRFDLVSVISGQAAPMNFDFRIDAPARLVSTRVDVDGGYVIPTVGVDLVGVEATNGNFVCSVEAQTCTSGTDTIPF